MSQLTIDRSNQLWKELDMKFNGISYIGTSDVNKDFNVHWTEITCDSNDEWNKKINKLKKEYNLRKN